MKDDASRLSPVLRLLMVIAGLAYFLGASGLTSIEAFGIKVELAAGLRYPLFFVAVEAIGIVVVGLELLEARIDRKLATENDTDAAKEALKRGWRAVDKDSRRKAGLIIGKSRVKWGKFLVLYLIPLAIGLICLAHYAVTWAT